MAYLNNTENERRYKAICAKYQDAVSRRKSAINLEETRVEVARARLKEIDDRIDELNRSNKISYEVGRERSRLFSQRATAKEKLRQAERQLSATRIGEDGLAEFYALINNK